MSLIFDTSILIDIDRGDKKTIAKIEELRKMYPAPATIGFISYFEFLLGLKNKNIKSYAIIGFLFAITTTLFIFALSRTTISNSVLLQSVQPFLLMFIAYELTNMLINKNQNRKIIYIIIITVATLVYGFNVERPINNFSYLFNSYELLTRNRCFDNNLKFFSTNNPSYAKIINLLRKQKGFNNKVFSFSTGDSAFYVLLNQKPPYYNAIFEGASYGNQNLAIKYMRDNEIEYVTLNTSKLSVQDTVPDYIRQGFLFKYILNNYQPFAVIGDHIILKKAQNNDFFASKILEQVEDYKNYLLDVYLYKIPHSEGLYKYNYLKNNNKIIIEGSIDKINSFLKKNNLSSSSKIIVLNSSTVNKSGSLIFIEFETKNGNSTTVYFNPCNKNEVCIINLSRIPFFYKERLVEKIIADKEYKGEIRIFDLKNSGNLW